VKIFLAGPSAQPAYGGPAYSVTGLAAALAAAGADVGFWTPDGSAVTTPLLSGDGGVRRLIGSASEALDRFGRPDVLHDNGLWRRHNHQLASLAAARSLPRIVSTRGMLEPWARGHKKVRKRVAWRAYQRRDLLRAACHHATSEQEAGHLQDLDLGVPVRMIPNGITFPAGRQHIQPVAPASSLDRTALFLGRLYPVKGLPLLIEAWRRVQPVGWRLLIAGPDQAGHRAEIEHLIVAARLTHVVSFAGPVDEHQKARLFERASIMVLPTLSESFGMVVLEALAHAVPVLTTVRAPWPMLATERCGWLVEPTADAIADGLRQATRTPLDDLQAMGVRGRDLVATRFDWCRIATEFLELYDGVGGRGHRGIA
jgi:glycosyltransferase involved in cell wall biosynthesis